MKILKKALFLLFLFTLSGCTNAEKKEDYPTIQEKLINMESYSCDADLTYISNKGENTYKIKQKAKNDGRYYIETIAPEDFKGHKIVFDGKIIWQYNPEVEQKISVADKDKIARKQISLFSFLENHLKSTEIALETSKTDEGIYTILEANIPKDNKYFSTEKLWINNETKLPEKLVIYDEDGKERVLVQYNNFEYNPKIEDSDFDVEILTNTNTDKE